MSDGRLVSAFFCALLVHAVLLGITLGPTVSPPLLVSDTSVTITLSRAIPEPAVDSIPEPIGEPVQKRLPVVEAVPPKNPVPVVEEPANVLPPPEPQIPEIAPEKSTQQIPDPIPVRITRTDLKKIVPRRTESSPIQAPSVARVDRKPDSSQDIKPPVSNQKPSPQKQTEPERGLERQSVTVIEAVPLYRHNPKPVYPKLARKRMWEGTVILSVTVESDGSVETCTVQQSSGYKILDRSALDAVKRWTFVPGTINGHQTVMTVRIPVTFKLKD